MHQVGPHYSSVISWRARLVRRISSWYVNRVDVTSLNIPKMRRRVNFLGGRIPLAWGVRVRAETIAGLHAEWVEPKGVALDKVLLYWHGGAYIVGSCATHRPMLSRLAKAAGMRALLPDYELAPEHPFPAAVQNAVAVYRELLARGYEPGNISVAGDSAGGGLCVAMLLALRDAGDPMPGAVALMSPWLDLAGQGESMTSRIDQDPWFDPQDLPYVTTHYCSEAERTEPLVSPVYADASALPRTLIQVGNDEILLSDSERLAANMQATGGTVEVDIWPGMWHVWQIFVLLMPESIAALRKLGRFLAQPAQ